MMRFPPPGRYYGQYVVGKHAYFGDFIGRKLSDSNQGLNYVIDWSEKHKTARTMVTERFVTEARSILWDEHSRLLIEKLQAELDAKTIKVDTEVEIHSRKDFTGEFMIATVRGVVDELVWIEFQKPTQHCLVSRDIVRNKPQ